jgi:hypothetical protein
MPLKSVWQFSKYYKWADRHGNANRNIFFQGLIVKGPTTVLFFHTFLTAVSSSVLFIETIF